MYGYESWIIKKAECQRIDAFKLWCWRRFLRIPWTVRRSNQSILKEISPKYSLEGLMLKLKFNSLAAWYQWRADSLEKALICWQRWKAGGEGVVDRGCEMVVWAHQLNGHEFEQTLRDGEGQGSLMGCSSWGCKQLDITESLNNSNSINIFSKLAGNTSSTPEPNPKLWKWANKSIF